LKAVEGTADSIIKRYFPDSHIDTRSIEVGEKKHLMNGINQLKRQY